MKVFRALAASALMLLGAATAAQAQSKIAYCNPELLVSLTSEAKAAEQEMRIMQQKLEEQANVKRNYYSSKIQEYQAAKQKGMTPELEEAKIKEIQQLEREIQEFIQNGQVQLQKKQEELLGPILDRIQKAIEEVAKAEGYTHVLNSTAGDGASILLYAQPSDNITEKVAKKMGLQMPAPQGSTPAAGTAPAGGR